MRTSTAAAIAAGTAALLAIATRLAWVCDDAYITLRCVENLACGDGLRWNTVDRVQTYTHPLWLLVLAAGRALSGEVYFTTVATSQLLSGAAVAWLLARARTAAAIAALAVVLASARAFVDYTTSGLETPLVYLLLVWFAATIAHEGPPVRRWTHAVLAAALLAMTRLDLLLLCAPAVLACARGVPLRTLVWRGALASSPLLLWLLFATLWYGSPLPNTAGAKLFATGIAAGDLAAQGAAYAWITLRDDPVLLLATALGLAAAWRRARGRWLALGALSYVVYTIAIGGDFMAGRFFLPPFVIAMAMLAPSLASRSPGTLGALATLAIALAATRGVPPWLCAPETEERQPFAEVAADHGICDERRFYARVLGMFGAEFEPPRFGSSPYDAWPEPRDERWFWLIDCAGTSGFRAGGIGHVVDPVLCDPLLTRLPARDPLRCRPGHVQRRLPAGYLESLVSGESRLLHPGLRAYHDALRTITQAPVFDGERLATLSRMLCGDYDAGLQAFVAEHYHTPPRVPVELSALPPPLPADTCWYDDARLHLVYEGGVAVALGAQHRATKLRIQVVGVHQLDVRFVHGGRVVGRALSQPPPFASGDNLWQLMSGVRTDTVSVPHRVGAFDTLWLDPGVPGGAAPSGPVAFGAITFE